LIPKLTLADAVIICLALVGIGALYLHYWGGSAPENATLHAQVLSQGATVSLNLHQAQIITITGPLGDSLLQVEEGRVRFIASPCPGKQCIRSGWQQQRGDFAACLPNRVSVHLHTQSDFDALVY
jgi:hypothetical protein